MNILAFATTILALLKSLEFVYLYQIKEYRFDRFDVYLREEGVLRVLYATPPKWPKKSLRNALIGALDLSFAGLLYYLYSFYPPAILVGLLVLSPFIGFLLTCMAVGITSVVAYMRRRQIVEQARRKITTSEAVFIGITGSYGKTSTKEFLYEILRHTFKVAKTDENMNTHVGVALSVLKNLHSDTEYFIAEAGAYKVGEIRRVCDLIHPRLAIVTTIGNQHLALFGSRRNLVAAKRELLDSLPQEGTAYINHDIPEYKEIVKDARYKAVSFATSGVANIKAFTIKETATTTSATVTYGKQTLHLTTRLVGRHNIQNLLPAVALALDVGMKPAEIEAAVHSLKPVASKLTKQPGAGGATLLLDTYSSNVEGFLAAIEIAKNHPQEHKIIITRGILELGSEKKSSYQRILKALAGTKLELMTTDTLFKTLGEPTQYFKNEQQMLDALQPLLNKHTLVVVEGKFSPSFVARLTHTSPS